MIICLLCVELISWNISMILLRFILLGFYTQFLLFHLIHLTISFRVASLALGYDSPMWKWSKPGWLSWRNNEHDGVSNHWRLDCLLSRLFRHGSKKTSKLSATGLCAGNSPGTGEFPTEKANNAEAISISSASWGSFTWHILTAVHLWIRIV